MALSRRTFLHSLAASSAYAQGRCRDGYGTAGCPLSREAATAPVKPPFAPTGWKTVALDRITWQVPDYRKEAAFYVALMGWKLRGDNGTEAELDMGGWGLATLKHAPVPRATVASLSFSIRP